MAQLSANGHPAPALITGGIAAVLIVPSWCVVFKPKFVTAAHYDEDGVLEV